MQEGVNRIWLRVKALVRRRQLDRDLEDELAFHLAMRGDTPNARRRFGNVTLWKERTRELWTFAPLEAVARICGTPAGSSARVPCSPRLRSLSLALGIGANTAIFSLMDAVLWKMLPVREPRTARAAGVHQRAWASRRIPLPVYEQLRDRSEVFSGMFAFSGEARWSLGAGGQADLVAGQLVSGYVPLRAGRESQAGRTLTSEDERTPGAHPVAVISDAYWTRRFGRDPSVIGMPITINGQPFTVVGVTPGSSSACRSAAGRTSRSRWRWTARSAAESPISRTRATAGCKSSPAEAGDDDSAGARGDERRVSTDHRRDRRTDNRPSTVERPSREDDGAAPGQPGSRTGCGAVSPRRWVCWRRWWGSRCSSPA